MDFLFISVFRAVVDFLFMFISVFHNVKVIGEWLLFVNTMFLDLNGHWFILLGFTFNGAVTQGFLKLGGDVGAFKRVE